MGERLAVELVATFLGSEHVLLAVASVPDPVREEVTRVEPDEHGPGVGVDRGVVVGEEDGAVAVGEGYARKVPEDEHEAPFLVVHVPEVR